MYVVSCNAMQWNTRKQIGSIDRWLDKRPLHLSWEFLGSRVLPIMGIYEGSTGIFRDLEGESGGLNSWEPSDRISGFENSILWRYRGTGFWIS